MVNLRQRSSVVKKPATNKRASSRVTSKINNNNNNNNKDDYEEEVEIDSTDSDDIELSEPDNEEFLNGYISDTNEGVGGVVEDEEEDKDEDFDIEDDIELSGSEDDKEIKRIIEKTEAETRNIPLTARQRVKLEGGLDDPFESKTTSDSTTILTDEQALRKSEKSRRRKLQRDAKMEETKRATIDRLLQKQKKPINQENNLETSLDNSKLSETNKILQTGMVRFIDNSNGPTLQFPDPETFDTFVNTFKPAIQSIHHDSLCQICKKNQSKYVHPGNGQLFCSLSCYKIIK